MGPALTATAAATTTKTTTVTGRLQDLILLVNLPMGTRKNFFEMYREFVHSTSKRFASPCI
jgi:hypothetical protein